MLATNLEEVDEVALRAMCTEHRRETSSLEWKQRLPGREDQQKQEFAKDVTALANLDGGDLVYGITEIDGEADQVLAITDEAADSAELRLRQVLDALVEPRLVGLEIRAIGIASGGYVLAIRVPASFEGPYSVRNTNNSRRFVVRNGGGTSDMSYDQVRNAFERLPTLRQQVTSFRTERLAAVKAGRSAGPMTVGALCVLHVIPLSGLAGRHTWDVRSLFRGTDCYSLVPDRMGGMSKRLNLLGGCAYVTLPDGACRAYAQVFRDGSIETVALAGRQFADAGGQVERRVASSSLVRNVRDGLRTSLAQLKAAGFRGSAVIGVSLLEAAGYRLARETFMFDDSEFASVDTAGDVVVPETWIDNLETCNADREAAAVLDVLWQSFGLERCPYFDAATGAYVSRD
jgi:hypothetical protein